MVKNLRYLRKQKGISQQQLASACGISQQSVNKYENHSVEPDISTLISMADYFDTTVDFLIGRNCEYDLDDKNLRLLPSEEALIRTFRQLSDAEKDCVRTVIEVMNTQKKN